MSKRSDTILIAKNKAEPDFEQWQEFLSPDQRLNLIADILATIAVRMAQLEE